MAVLLTLIYLAVQVKQTRKLQQAEAVRVTAPKDEIFMALRDSPYIPDILEKLNNDEELSHSEKQD